MTHTGLLEAVSRLTRPQLLRDTGVYIDFGFKTCVRLHECDDYVAYVILDMSEGLRVDTLRVSAFHHIYKPLDTIGGAQRAILKYAALARYVGATKAVFDILTRITPIPQEDMTMAIAQQATRDAKKAAAVSAAKSDDAKKTGGSEKTGNLKKPEVSAAARFQELIMRGTMTDDQIFQAVQTEFNLPDSKRGYVQWYRNHLKKQGKNPPETKNSPETKKPTAEKKPTAAKKSALGKNPPEAKKSASGKNPPEAKKPTAAKKLTAAKKPTAAKK